MLYEVEGDGELSPISSVHKLSHMDVWVLRKQNPAGSLAGVFVCQGSLTLLFQSSFLEAPFEIKLWWGRKAIIKDQQKIGRMFFLESCIFLTKNTCWQFNGFWMG